MVAKADVKQAIALMHSETEWQFFFEKIDSPDWLQPLIEEGIFKEPENIKIENGIVRILSWPQGKYLIKVASIKPNEVADIIKNISKTDNPNVLEACVDAMIEMPIEVSAPLSKTIKNWLDKEYQYGLFQKIGRLIVKYFQEKKDEEALLLCNKLLYVSPEDYSRAKKSFYATNTWEYNEIIKVIAPSIISAETKKKFIELLARHLKKIVSFRINEVSGAYVDNSSVWRREVDHSNFDVDDDPRDILVTWIYVLGSEISKINEEYLKGIFLELSKNEAPIFKRIALFLLSKFSVNGEVIISSLANPDFLLSDDTWHEYAILLRERFSSLGHKGQDILNFIATFDFKGGKDPVSYNEYKRYKLLTLIQKNLTGEWKDKFEALKAKNNNKEIERPEYLYYFSGVREIKPISPIDLDDFKKKELNDIKQYLIDWVQPVDEYYGESTAGVALLLQKTVTVRFDEFADNLEIFKLNNARFVGAIIQGFSEALAECKQVNWLPIIQYCLWIVKQKDNPSKSNNKDIGMYTSWNSVKHGVFSFIEKGFTSKNVFSVSLKDSVWDVIKEGVSDFDRDIVDEADDKDYYLIAINRARGVAFECAIRYGLWLLQCLGIDKEKANRSYCPELFAVLDQHLDTKNEKSKYIWAVYGRWFPWLYLLDGAWAKENSTTLFSFESPLSAYPMAAWNAYLMYSQPYDNIFDLIKQQYIDAVIRLNKDYEESDNKPASRLVDHIVLFILRDKIQPNSPIINALYKSANLKIRLHIISFMGRLLNKDVIESAIKFWEFRVNECNKLNDWNELAKFGYWVNTEALPEEWTFKQAKFVLEKTHTILPSHMVVETLVDLCPDYPEETFNVFKLIVENKVAEHGFFIWRSAAEHLIPMLLDSPCREETIALIHKLGSYGLVEFGKFINQ